jgi:hypothetical protein
MNVIDTGKRSNEQVVDAAADLYGSVSVVTGGSGWIAARIGVGGSG